VTIDNLIGFFVWSMERVAVSLHSLNLLLFDIDSHADCV